MSLILVESAPDVASVGIANALRRRSSWEPNGQTFEGQSVLRWAERPEVLLVRTEQHHIHAEGLDASLKDAGLPVDEIVFLSKHKSESARPTLTAHPLGNYRDAALGGKPGTLTPVNGATFTHMLRCLAWARDETHFPAEVAFEVTHHGPALDVPAFFVELGSSDPQWQDPAGHEVLATAVERFLRTPPRAYPIVVGLGGGHYGPRFTEAALTKAVHFAHLVPTYHAEHLHDPAPTIRELRRACPGLSGVYYHDGTLKKDIRERWMTALRDADLPLVESKSWSLAGF